MSVHIATCSNGLASAHVCTCTNPVHFSMTTAWVSTRLATLHHGDGGRVMPCHGASQPARSRRNPDRAGPLIWHRCNKARAAKQVCARLSVFDMIRVLSVVSLLSVARSGFLVVPSLLVNLIVYETVLTP